MLAPLLSRLVPGARREAERAAPRSCRSCGSTALWPSGFARSGAPWVCRGCGAHLEAAAVRQELGAWAQPAPLASLDKDAAAAVSDQLAAAAVRSYEHRLVPRLASYVDAVAEALDAQRPRERTTPPLRVESFLDLGEPVAATLPDGRMLIGLGLLASLEDEAQLAFVVARERVILEAGLVARHGTSLAATVVDGRRPRRREKRHAEALVRAALFVGYGAGAERFADERALARVVRAEYEPDAAVQALDRLDKASLPERGSRFVLDEDRRRRLVAASRVARRPRESIFNREVYARAVAGFAVFTRRA